MTGQNTTRIISGNGQIMYRRGKIVSISAIAPVAGAKLYLYNNATGAGNPIYTADGSVSTPAVELWIPFKVLYGKVTGTASYNLVIN